MMDEGHSGISGRSRKRRYFYTTDECVLTLLLSGELNPAVNKQTLLNITSSYAELFFFLFSFLKNSSHSFFYFILLSF